VGRTSASAASGTVSRLRLPAAAALCLGACASFPNLPPIHEIEEGLPGGVTEERWLFGLIEHRRYPDGSELRAWRPFAAEARRPPEDGQPTARKLHVVPPFGSRVRTPEERSTQVVPIWFDLSVGTDEERAEGTSDDDFTIFPVLFWGCEPGQGPYFMLFPVFGTVRQRLFADRIDVVLFPAYARTETGTWSSTHLLWPLVAWGCDTETGRTHARFLPFWSQTDGPAGTRRTLLWPFVHWGTEVREDRTSDGWLVWPLLGRRTSRDGDLSETTVLWPFFSWSSDERTGDTYRAILWPIHKHLDRPGKERATWWWPAYGSYESETERSNFYVWPIGWSTDRFEGDRVVRRRFVVPVWMRREWGPRDGPPDRVETRSWPLFSHERTADGYESVRIPEIVPFFGWQAGETAYADTVALYRGRSDAEGRAAWDLPFGIVRWRRDAEGASKLTLLWWITIPLGDGK
jgi:hypothetical protein